MNTLVAISTGLYVLIAFLTALGAEETRQFDTTTECVGYGIFWPLVAVRGIWRTFAAGIKAFRNS